MLRTKRNSYIKRYNWGGYTQSGEFGQDLGNTLSTSASLAGTGMAVGGPVGAIVGGAVGLSAGAGKMYSNTKFGQSNLGKAVAFANPILGISNLINNRKRKIAEKEQRKADERQFAFNEDLVENNTQGVLQNYDTDGTMRDTFAYGGNTNPNSINVNPNNKMDLGDGMMQFKGAKHENGGVAIDTNADMIQDAEVEGDEVYEERGNRIYSDRLKPSKEVLDQIYNTTGYKVSGTYADISKKLGNIKGKNKNTGTPQSKQKEDLLTQRIEEALDLTFENQEMTKPVEQNTEMMKYGGKLKRYYSGGTTDPNILSSYKIKNPDGSYTLVEIPDEGYTSNVPATRTNVAVLPQPTVPTESTPKPYYTLPSMRKVKQAPSFNSKTREVSKRKFWDGGTFNPHNFNDVTRRRNFTTIKDTRIEKAQQQKPIDDFINNNKKINTLSSGFTNPMLNLNTSVGVDNVGVGFNNSSFGTNNFKNSQQNQLGLGFKDSSAVSNTAKGGMNFDSSAVLPALGMAANALSFAANKRDINKMQINQTPNLTAPPRFTYNDTSGRARQQLGESVKSANRAIQNSSLQNKGANVAKVRAASFGAMNDIENNESNRRLQAEQSFNSRLDQTNMYNTGTVNQIKGQNLDRYNDKIGLDINNRQALVEGITGNVQVMQQVKNDKAKALLTAAGQGDTESLSRFLKDFPKLAKQLGLTGI